MLNERIFCLLRILVALLISSREAKSPAAPLLVFSEGCSGSSSLGRMISRLLRMEGIHTYNLPATDWDWEVCHKDKNQFYNKHEGMATAMKQLVRAAQQNETTLVIKCEVSLLTKMLSSGGNDDHNVLEALKGSEREQSCSGAATYWIATYVLCAIVFGAPTRSTLSRSTVNGQNFVSKGGDRTPPSKLFWTLAV